MLRIVVALAELDLNIKRQFTLRSEIYILHTLLHFICIFVLLSFD